MLPTKVLFTWNVRAELQEYIKEKLAKFPHIKLTFPTENQVKIKDFLDIDQVDVLVGWRHNEETLKAAFKVKLIINPGAGVEHFAAHKTLLQERNISLTNCHGNAYFSAQHAVALLLTATNRIVTHHQFLQSGQWRTGDKEARSLPLCYRKIGLLGYGAINQHVHKMLQGFNTDFSILKRTWNEKEKLHLPENTTTFDSTQLHDFLTEIDTLIIAIPNTPKTKNLIGEKELHLLGKDSIVVNVGRGAIIQEAALYEALKNKTIHSAAIDVWYNYKPTPNEQDKKYPYEFPFHELDNIILSPHRAASPLNDLKRWDSIIENIGRFAFGKTKLFNVVELDEGY